MIFSSTLFLFLFLPLTILIYYLLQDKLKNLWLFLVSIVFYSWGEPICVFLMLLTIAVNYFVCVVMERVQKKSGRRTLLAAGIAMDIGVLLYFKYFNFFLDNLNGFFGANIQAAQIALPVGISFYTFQVVSYLIDVYRKTVPAQRSILNLGLYITFFPQLIAGPIVRYADIAEKIKSRKPKWNDIAEGGRLFCIGLAKKVLIADRVAPLADLAFGPAAPAAALAWLGVIAYALQIYFDFSGYSDMARGLGKIFGFDFMINFQYPYISCSIKEFWRRWHISLSTWFRDYVYIPLGGSRCGALRAYLNRIIIFFLTGLWHGASWSFIVWGVYYGVFLILEQAFLGKMLEKMPKAIRHAYTMLVVLVGWVFFRSDTLASAFAYLKSMFSFSPVLFWTSVSYLDMESLVCILLGLLFSMPIWPYAEKRLLKGRDGIRNTLIYAAFLLSVLYVAGNGFSPFLYFRF